MKTNVVALLSGVLFSIGLSISGMAQPQKVIGFLDVFGAWDLSLAFVMFGGVGSYFMFQLQIKKYFPTPVLGEAFQLPSSKNLDCPLIFGALLFGVGWGLGGYCPGPSLVSLGSGSMNATVFVLAMGVGMLLAERLISPFLFIILQKN